MTLTKHNERVKGMSTMCPIFRWQPFPGNNRGREGASAWYILHLSLDEGGSETSKCYFEALVDLYPLKIEYLDILQMSYSTVRAIFSILHHPPLEAIRNSMLQLFGHFLLIFPSWPEILPPCRFSNFGETSHDTSYPT